VYFILWQTFKIDKFETIGSQEKQIFQLINQSKSTISSSYIVIKLLDFLV